MTTALFILAVLANLITAWFLVNLRDMYRAADVEKAEGD